MKTKTVLLYVVITVLILSTDVNSRTLCSRIFFQNINEDKMPYKFIEGVFVKEGRTINSFPVYKREDGKLYFYLEEKLGEYMLLFGLNVGSTIGFEARITRGLKSSAELWLARGQLNTNDVFGGLITDWIYNNKRDSQDYTVNSQPYIKAVCVDSDFRQCNSDEFYVTNSEFFFTDPKSNYFKRVTDTFRNLRPVYKHSVHDWYLQYIDNHWIVTTTSYTSFYMNSAILRVRDYALRPEYITNVWTEKDSDNWSMKPKVKVRCRGIISKDTCSISNPCLNLAECVHESGKETICVCRPGFYGPLCEKSNTCPTPQAQSTEIGFTFAGNIPGDMAMTFCSTSHLPAVRYAICTNGGKWSRQGTECGKDSSEPTAGVSTKPALNLDDMPDESIGILVGAVLTQVLLPFVLWYCGLCAQICTENDNEEEEDHEIERKRGLFHNASLCRIFSMDFYISFFLWLIYLIGCQKTQCTQYGEIFEQLNIMAIVMLVICPLFVFIESICSHEMDYLSNIMEDDTAWEYIQKMHAIAPLVPMTVQCYHMETRTRVVHYTDGNGNSRTRTETYQERVDTYTDRDEFKYGCWVDVSEREMPALSNVALTRLKIEHFILFGDDETRADFDRQKEDMLERNRHRDDKMEFSSSRSIPGIEKRISAYVDPSLKPWWIGRGYFILAILLLLSWPYRWLFKAKTSKNYYDLKKKMYKSTRPPPEVANMYPVNVSTPEVEAESSDVKTYPPNVAPQTYPTANYVPYPPTNQGPAYPPTNQGVPYPPTNQGPAYPPTNQGVPYPPTDQGPAYPPTNQGVPYPATNQGLPLTDLTLANQGVPYPPTSQGPPLTPANQGVPDTPPPDYKSVVNA